MDWIGHALTSAVAILLLLAALADIATRIIPDWVAALLALLGLAVRAFAGLYGLGLSIALAAVLFLVLVLLHARGAMGGGDVKLAAATALGLSPEALYQFVLATALAGGVLALIHLVLRAIFSGARVTPPPRGAPCLRRVAAAERWRIARRGALPYGVAIACGGIWVVLAS